MRLDREHLRHGARSEPDRGEYDDRADGERDAER
jgi:hypothetical protein